jgi:glycosyltransferase involved in cell wall biosynthesis
MYMKKKLHIGVLTGRTPYPNGMAASQRIHLMARAMAETGADVNVWVDGLDGWAESRNHEAIGNKNGIPYEFLLGKTQASEYKWQRVLDRLTLALAARQKITEAARTKSLDALYFYTSILKLDFERIVVRNSAGMRKIPVVLDLCEAPWSLNLHQSIVESLISPLWGVDGVISISRFLENWVQEENLRTSRAVRSLHVPILTDTNEIVPSNVPPLGKTVMFSGSPAYDETICFLLAAMEIVWANHPDCKLVITGGATESTLGKAVQGKGEKIRYTGFVERNLLLREYSEAAVLAIPLFADVRSHARFPTKLGEYLASGRAVVTTWVGEIPHYLKDGLNACVITPGDVQAFGEAICLLLSSPDRAKEIGLNGREVAEKCFHYANYGVKLCEFFTSLSSRASLPEKRW